MRLRTAVLAIAACLTATSSFADVPSGPFLNVTGQGTYFNIAPAAGTGTGGLLTVPLATGAPTLPVLLTSGLGLWSGGPLTPASHPFGPTAAICTWNCALPSGGALIAADLTARRSGQAVQLTTTSAGAIRPLVIPTSALRGSVR